MLRWLNDHSHRKFYQTDSQNLKSAMVNITNREEETDTTTTEKKSFGELFWPQRKIFQAGGGYIDPIKTRKPYLPPKFFLSAPIFFGKEKFLTQTGAGWCMLSFFQYQCPKKIRRNSLSVIWMGYLGIMSVNPKAVGWGTGLDGTRISCHARPSRSRISAFGGLPTKTSNI